MGPIDHVAHAARSPAPLLATAALLGACAATPPLPAPVVETAPPSPPVVAAPERPARWIRAGGATSVGVPWGVGRLVLLGGRRALMADDGTLRLESALAPEPLLRVLRVPTTTGPLLVAQGAHGIYRLDDPLGAPVLLARSAGSINLRGAGPGVVAVEGSGLGPRLLDARTGQPAELRGLPEPRLLRALAFRDDAREGAALLHGAGLWVTADGGATFRRAVEAAPGTADRARGLRMRGGAVVAVLEEDKKGVGLEALVDIAAGTLGPPLPAPAETQPLLKWIEDSERDDPLGAAAAGGVPLAGGRALVTGPGGNVGRVDLETGAVLDLARVAEMHTPPRHRGGCSLGRAGAAVWLGCEAHEEGWFWSLPLDAPTLAPGAPVQSGHRVRSWATSPSGGALFGSRVRRPDGSWWRSDSAQGALSDGRAAALHIPRPRQDPDAPAAPGALQVVLTDAAGKEEALRPLRFYPEDRLLGEDWQSNHIALIDAIEEDAEGALHFVLVDHHEAFAVVQARGREATARSFTWARLHAGRGLAVAADKLFASVDGGASWDEIPAPEGVVAASVEEVRQIHGNYGEDSMAWSMADVSEVGARVGGWLRLGWGAQAPLAPAPPPPTGGVMLAEVPRNPSKLLVCTNKTPAPARAAHPAAPPRKPGKPAAPPRKPAAPPRKPVAPPEGPSASLVESPAGTTVMVHDPGHDPWPLATIALRGLKVMPPNRDGVALVLYTEVTRLVRIVPLPPRGQPPRAPVALPLDGWTDVGTSDRSVADLPVCGAKAPATRMPFEAPRGALLVRVDGTDEPAHFTRGSYDVRVGPGVVCIAGVGWSAPGDEPGFHYEGRYRHVSADLVAKRAEGQPMHTRDEVDALTCTLEEAPAPR